MADILLSHGYFLFEDPKEKEIMKPYPPLGLLYISAYLRQQGFSVEIFDSTFSQYDRLCSTLEAGPPGVLGIYVNLMTRGNVLKIIKNAKKHGWKVVVGGPEAANYPENYIRYQADAVVIGEGEQTLAELLPELDRSGPNHLHKIPGVVFMDDEGQIIRNPERSTMLDINLLPWPDRDQIDIQRYVDVWHEHHGMGSINLITARGCPYRCKWCSHSVFGYSHRRRDYIDCADEVEHLLNTYRPDQVWYADDVFTISHPWLYNYSKELKRRNIRLPFETISRADRMMKEDVLQTLSDMGCYRVWIGSESGSQRILDAMQRQVKVEEVEWATKTAQKYGIEVGMFLMWGYDGETEEDIEATVEHVKRCNPDIFFTTVTYPIKDTLYYEDVKNQIVSDVDWAEGSDRDYKIKGRHSRRYYGYADQWLRSEVAAFRLEHNDPAAAIQKRREAIKARSNMQSVDREVEA